MLLRLIALQPLNSKACNRRIVIRTLSFIALQRVRYLPWLNACFLRFAIFSLWDIGRSLADFTDQFDVGGLPSRLPVEDSLPKVRKQEPWMDLGDLTFAKPLSLRMFKLYCKFHQANV